jgi:hypothetical protein
VSLTKIKAFAKLRSDLTFECPTVDEEPSGDGEHGTPTTL